MQQKKPIILGKGRVYGEFKTSHKGDVQGRIQEIKPNNVSDYRIVNEIKNKQVKARKY